MDKSASLSNINTIKGPWFPWWLCQAMLQIAPNKTLDAWQKRYGNRFIVPARKNLNFLYLSSPSDVDEIIKKFRGSIKSTRSHYISKLVGNFAIAMYEEGSDQHKEGRALVLSAINKIEGERLKSSIFNSITSITRGWANTQKFNATEFSKALMAEVAIFIMLNRQPTETENKLFLEIIDLVTTFDGKIESLAGRMGFDWKLYLGLASPWSKVKLLREKIIRMCSDMLLDEWEERRLLKDIYMSRGMLGNHLVKNIYVENDLSLRPLKLADFLISIYVAAMDTTSSSAAFAIEHAAREPQIFEELRREIKSQKNMFDFISTSKKLDSYCWEVINFYTPVVEIPRVVTKEITLNNLKLVQGTMLMICIPNYNQQKFDSLKSFSPWRFVDINASTSDIMSFGYGERKCPGMRLAILEIKLILAYFLLEWSIKAICPQIQIEKNLLARIPARGQQLIAYKTNA